MSCPTNCVSASWPATWLTRNASLMCILLKSPVRSWTVTSVTRPTSLSGVSVGVSPNSCLLNISGASRLYHTFAFHLSLILRAAARDFFSAMRAARRGVPYLSIGGSSPDRAEKSTRTKFFQRSRFLESVFDNPTYEASPRVECHARGPSENRQTGTDRDPRGMAKEVDARDQG